MKFTKFNCWNDKHQSFGNKGVEILFYLDDCIIRIGKLYLDEEDENCYMDYKIESNGNICDADGIMFFPVNFENWFE